MKNHFFSIIIFTLTLFSLTAQEKQSSTVTHLATDPQLQTLLNPKIRESAENFLQIPKEPTGVIASYQLPYTKTESQLNLPHLLTHFSSLKGIEYFSISSKKNKILFKEIFTISLPPEIKKFNFKTISNYQQEDPSPEELENPYPQNYYFYQDDSSFGKSLWKATLNQIDQSWVLTLENLTVLRRIGIKMIDENKLKMIFILTHGKEEIQLNAIISADIRPVRLLKERIKGSLGNRLTAICQFFLEKMDCQLQPDEI